MNEVYLYDVLYMNPKMDSVKFDWSSEMSINGMFSQPPGTLYVCVECVCVSKAPK